MRNAWRVSARDLRRILRVPKVWAIVIGLLIMPSLYAWVNIIAFWDPYSDTKEIKVAVVNLDRGAESKLTGKLNVGDQVVAQLKDNHDLGWQFLDQDQAMAAVRSGDSYAAIIIPARFSEDLLTITQDEFIRPKLDYYVNEKANAIAPKITGVGASTLETQINSTFVSTVAQTVSEDLKKAGVNTETQLLTAKSRTLKAIDDAAKSLGSARTGLTDIDQSLSVADGALGKTQKTLLDIDCTIGDVQKAITQSQDLAKDVQRGLTKFTDSATKVYVKGAADLSKASTKLNGSMSQATTKAQQANLAVGSAVTDVSAVVDANGKAIERLQDVLDQLSATPEPSDSPSPSAPASLEPSPSAPGTPAADPPTPAERIQAAITELQARNAADQRLLKELTTLNTDVDTVITRIQASSDAINAAVQDSSDSATSISNALTGTIPDINQAMSSLSASAGALSSALGSQRTLTREARNLLTGLDTQLGDTNDALGALDGNLKGAQSDLKGMRSDIVAVSAADNWKNLRDLTKLEPQQIAQFMAGPVQVKQHTLFPVPTYGSAMAPLFTNLSLWIAAFMLVVLFKQEVDTEGVEGLTVRQAYFGRFMFLALLNVVQALLVSIGDVVIGVQMTSPVVFVATSVFIGLVYLSVIYALAVSFGYIGKGLAVLLVIMQIPGASGIYPIQMMPAFFRAFYPFFPFTYGINALREIIGGFYDHYYWRAMAMLLLFAVLAFILGVFFRQRLGNFARLFNGKLADTGLFVSEDVQILGSRRRMNQIVQALTDRAKFRTETARQVGWFEARRRSFTVIVVLVGLAATVVLGLFAWSFPDSKATVLGLWGVVCLAAMGSLATFAYLQQSAEFGTEVSAMPDPELQQALVREETATHSTAVLDDISNKGATQ